jgi:hypothetical protein
MLQLCLRFPCFFAFLLGSMHGWVKRNLKRMLQKEKKNGLLELPLPPPPPYQYPPSSLAITTSMRSSFLPPWLRMKRGSNVSPRREMESTASCASLPATLITSLVDRWYSLAARTACPTQRPAMSRCCAALASPIDDGSSRPVRRDQFSPLAAVLLSSAAPSRVHSVGARRAAPVRA